MCSDAFYLNPDRPIFMLFVSFLGIVGMIVNAHFLFFEFLERVELFLLLFCLGSFSGES